MVHMWRSEDNFWESVLSFYHVSPGDWTQGVATSTSNHWGISLAPVYTLEHKSKNHYWYLLSPNEPIQKSCWLSPQNISKIIPFLTVFTIITLIQITHHFSWGSWIQFCFYPHMSIFILNTEVILSQISSQTMLFIFSKPISLNWLQLTWLPCCSSDMSRKFQPLTLCLLFLLYLNLV